MKTALKLLTTYLGIKKHYSVLLKTGFAIFEKSFFLRHSAVVASRPPSGHHHSRAASKLPAGRGTPALHLNEAAGGSCCDAGLGLVWQCYCIYMTLVCLIQTKN